MFQSERRCKELLRFVPHEQGRGDGFAIYFWRLHGTILQQICEGVSDNGQ